MENLKEIRNGTAFIGKLKKIPPAGIAEGINLLKS